VSLQAAINRGGCSCPVDNKMTIKPVDFSGKAYIGRQVEDG
jgi:hypothetical protein